jgi:hypothetical protein
MQKNNSDTAINPGLFDHDARETVDREQPPVLSEVVDGERNRERAQPAAPHLGVRLRLAHLV